MADTKQFIDELAALGVKVELKDGKIKFGPTSKVTPELLLKMRGQREQLIAYLKRKSQENVELDTFLVKQSKKLERQAKRKKANEDKGVGENKSSNDEKEVIIHKNYGDFRRRHFFFFFICAFLLCSFMVPALEKNIVTKPDYRKIDDSRRYTGEYLLKQFYSTGNMIFLGIMIIPVSFRLKNIGYNPSLCLLIFLPPINTILGWACLCYPEGYADKSKKDKSFQLSKVSSSGTLIESEKNGTQ